MGDLRDMQWTGNTNVYSEEQIEAVLNDLGLEIDSETSRDFICFCPFHNNTETPSFSVSKATGVFLCFNAMCSERGNLIELVKRKSAFPLKEFEAMRFILKRKTGAKLTAQQKIDKIKKQRVDFDLMPAAPFDRMYESFWDYPDAVRYMVEERGFDEDVLREFYIGYSAKNDMITVPMHDPEGNYIGLIGRALESKRFKNSTALPVSRTMWNLHRAKKAGDTVIICEASFDAMRIHQAGYPNVVALLGGNLSNLHIDLLERYFSGIVIMTDFDDKSKYVQKNCRKCEDPNTCQGHNPGRELGNLIASRVRGKRIRWAATDYKLVYPHGAKDAGDMTDDEIVHCIKNSVSNFEYQQWRLT
ncbi:DNA primase [Streptomyces phage Battuta]|uniref:DNA primase n=1 Tax=Streptomyces phage Battuta TaxID=2805843 RepID=A0A890UTD8_9CAUD|nr:DNA primase [Streptomyces phage Battuta]